MTPSELRTFIEGMEAAGMTTPTPEQWAVIREKMLMLSIPAPLFPPNYPRIFEDGPRYMPGIQTVPLLSDKIIC